MKHFFLLIVSLLSFASVGAQEVAVSDSVTTAQTQTLRFGYFSYEEAIKAMPDYAMAMESLAKLKATYDEELTRSEQDFSRKFNEFIEGQKNFPENILLKRQKELQQLMDESLKFKAEAKNLLTKSENELMAPLRSKLDEVLKIIGMNNNFAFILNTDNNSYPFINTTFGEDCNALIAEELAK